MSVSTTTEGIRAVSTPLGDADVASREGADEDLGPQTIRPFAVKGVAAIGLDDGHGGGLDQDGQKPYAREGP